jgi:hypothetical protein
MSSSDGLNCVPPYFYTISPRHFFYNTVTALHGTAALCPDMPYLASAEKKMKSIALVCLLVASWSGNIVPFASAAGHGVPTEAFALATRPPPPPRRTSSSTGNDRPPSSRPRSIDGTALPMGSRRGKGGNLSECRIMTLRLYSFASCYGRYELMLMPMHYILSLRNGCHQNEVWTIRARAPQARVAVRK